MTSIYGHTLRDQLRAFKGSKKLTLAKMGGTAVSATHLGAFLRDDHDLTVSRLEQMLRAHGLRIELVPCQPEPPTPHKP